MADGAKCYVWDGERPSTRKGRAKITPSLKARRKENVKQWTLKKGQIESAKEIWRSKSSSELDRFLGSLLHDDFFYDSAGKEIDYETVINRKRLPIAVKRGGAESLKALKDGLISWAADNIFASLDSTGTANLRTCLKSILSDAMEWHLQKGGPRYMTDAVLQRHTSLDYDLGVLQSICKIRRVPFVVVTISDLEVFDLSLLSDLITFMHSWLDRIPFAFVLGFSLSEDILFERLPSSILRLLNVEKLSSPQSLDFAERLLRTTLETDPDLGDDPDPSPDNIRRPSKTSMSAFIGPRLLEEMLQRNDDDPGQGSGVFESDLKLAYFFKYVHDPLSVLLFQDVNLSMLDKDGFEQLRSLPSFKRMTMDSETGEERGMAVLLDNDLQALIIVAGQVQGSYDKIVWLGGALKILECLAELLRGEIPTLTYSSMYIKALKGVLKDSTFYRDALLQMKRLDSKGLQTILSLAAGVLFRMPPSAWEISPDSFADILEELEKLVYEDPEFRLEHNIISPSIIHEPSTPSKNNRQPSSRGQAAPSQKEEIYLKLLAQAHEMLQNYLEKALISMQEIPFHEILFYDQRIPHRDALNPRPRFALERALSSPHDYLNCRCCAHVASTSGGTQPSVAILYQLYLESGSLLNVKDLWSAYKSVFTGGSAVEENGEYDSTVDSKMMALFMRSLADLKMLGLIKPSKKKPDHVAKLAWKGL